MGTDKAFLAFGTETLLERALELARGVAEDVRSVGGRDQVEAFAPVV